MDQTFITKFKIALLLTRISIFVVFLIWTSDKIINPDHGSQVFEHFYGISVTTDIMVAIGWLQLVFVIVFGLGLWKKWSYLAILMLHAGSTFSSFPLYLDPFNNLLFFAAWPMLAACLMLFMFRDYDTLDLYLLKE